MTLEKRYLHLSKEKDYWYPLLIPLSELELGTFTIAKMFYGYELKLPDIFYSLPVITGVMLGSNN